MKSRESGAALIIVLGCLVLAGFALAGVIELTRYAAEGSRREAQLFEARLLAESGLALGLHPEVSPVSSLLHQERTGGYRIDVRVTSEQGRLWVNDFPAEYKLRGMEELFIIWGVNPSTAEIAAQSLADWVDSDDEARPLGAESDYYDVLGFQDYPRNGPMLSVEEMLLVRGMDEVAAVKPDWRDFFTIYGDGKLDVNAAPVDVIQAFGGVTAADAERFVATRDGADRVPGTVDDQLFTGENLEEAVNLLAIPQERLAELGQVFTLEGTLLRVESKATVSDLVYTRVVVADRATREVWHRTGR